MKHAQKHKNPDHHTIPCSSSQVPAAFWGAKRQPWQRGPSRRLLSHLCSIPRRSTPPYDRCCARSWKRRCVVDLPKEAESFDVKHQNSHEAMYRIRRKRLALEWARCLFVCTTKGMGKEFFLLAHKQHRKILAQHITRNSCFMLLSKNNSHSLKCHFSSFC